MGIWRRRRFSLPRPGFKQSGAKPSVQSACGGGGVQCGFGGGRPGNWSEGKKSVLQTPTRQSGNISKEAIRRPPRCSQGWRRVPAPVVMATGATVPLYSGK